MRKAFYVAAMLSCVFCFLVSAAGAEEVARYQITGEAGYGKDVFKFKSAIASWNEKERTLEVGLFPFDVNDEDARKVKDWHMMFYATTGKPSPNPSKWSSPPYMVVMVRFSGASKKYGIDDVSDYGLNVVDVKGKKTSAVFLSAADAREIIKALRFSPANLKSLQLRVDETKDRSMLEGFRYKATIGGK